MWRSFTFRLIFRLLDRSSRVFIIFVIPFDEGNWNASFIRPIASEIKFLLILILFAVSRLRFPSNRKSFESTIGKRGQIKKRWNHRVSGGSMARCRMCLRRKSNLGTLFTPSTWLRNRESSNSVLDSVDRVSRDAKPPNNPPSPPFRSCILRPKRSSIVAKLFRGTIFYDTSSLLKGCYISRSPFQNCCSSFLKFKISHKWMQRSMDQIVDEFIVYVLYY